MSRIDEALKRVAMSGTQAADMTLRRRLESLDERPVLDSYAPEVRPADVPAEQADELPLSPISAPRAGKGHQLGPFDPAVDGKLVVSKKKKATLVKELRALKFTPIQKVQDARKEGEFEPVVQDDADPDESAQDAELGAADYDYLLGVSIIPHSW